MVRPVGGGTHPAQQAVSEARRGTVSMTCHMGPLVAVWRVGLTGKCRLQDRVATVDDLIFFLAQHAKAAVESLEKAALAAVLQNDAKATAKLLEGHKKAYGIIFASRVRDGPASAAQLLARTTGALRGVRFGFPLYKWTEAGKYRLAEGNGWGGARQGQAYEAQKDATLTAVRDGQSRGESGEHRGLPRGSLRAHLAAMREAKPNTWA
ncbi:hypothetical protein CLOP_g1262 [Closterium sp. NIES-67]|nr:hypothetical protein CLOP_g1262 [Closterium sp. NIES-67]